MDINRLLSPDEGGARAAPMPQQPSNSMPSPRKPRRPAAGGKRNQSNLSQEVRRSPERMDTSGQQSSASGYANPPTRHHHQAYQSNQQASTANFRPLHQPAHAGGEAQSAYGYVQVPVQIQRPVMAHRHSSQSSTRSTPDTLAGESRASPFVNRTSTTADPAPLLPDLAALQRQPFSRNDSANNASTRRSPSVVNQSSVAAPPIGRTISSQSVADITMAEAPAQTPPPRTFTSNALTETESQTVTDLLNHLGESSYAYDSHLQLISLLHKGFVTHSCPPEGSDEQGQDPHTFGLLAELRQARESMDSRFAVGEDVWLDWLSDEVALAKSSEERIAVTELFQKAVQDEPTSVALWSAYANWIESSHAACNNLPGADQSGWSEDDKEVCKDLFTKDMLLSVLEQAVPATQWRIDQSHLIWNRYISAVQPEDLNTASRQDLERVQSHFIERLRIPSSGWEETRQLFWPLMTRIHGDNWEAAMSQINEIADPAKIQMGLRDEHELKLERAINSGDKNEAFNEFARYLKWEKFRRSKKRGGLPYEKELRAALFERALLRFPTYTDWWLDYVDFVISEKPSSHDPSSSVLPLLERATRHCPWSGELWAKRILRSDVERKPYHEIESIKHRATNSGLLDVGGMEELVKVLMEWCSYLRRNAFTSTSSEDDLDTAEVGIMMALEDVQQAGTKVYGEDFQGDPLYRLERIQMKFFGEARRVDDARNIWRTLVPKQCKSFEFWHKYYSWELLVWAHHRLSDSHRIETTETAPHFATSVVEDMLSQRIMDLPESALELFMAHFQQHESVEKLQAAGIEAREYSKRTTTRRAKEAEEAAANAARQLEEQVAAMRAPEAAEASTNGKRKRDEASEDNTHKKSKTQDAVVPINADDYSASASAQGKRDRENSTITITNLDPGVAELDLKKFFRDCGNIKSVNIVQKPSNDSAVATVEFEVPEDVDSAKVRNGKELNGREVHIQSGSRSTLYVANYPAEYDETTVRKLFEGYGEVVNVRFPSLKYNSRRRFCYVQFLTSDQAQAAENAMNDKMLDGQHRLLAKIADPETKKNRSGAQAEGREVFVKNLENNADEEEIKQLFSQFGTVVSMNLLKRANGVRLGNGFVVFSSADEATKAVEQGNNKPFYDRILNVSFSTPRGGDAPKDKARKTDIIIKHSASPEPPANGHNDRRGSDVSMASAPHTTGSEDMAKTVRERKIAILNLPDTVNDTRIRSEMEKHGPIVKIQLRREQDAAIVEFADIKVAFNVRGGVDCSSLGEKVRTGDVAEIFAKGKKTQDGSAAPGTGFGGLRPAAVSRPGQQRGGRRGGLGFKRGGFGGGGATAAKNDASNTESGTNGAGSARSNADFKAMFEQSRQQAEAIKAEEVKAEE
jgi:RNA recognition motif-containing protein